MLGKVRMDIIVDQTEQRLSGRRFLYPNLSQWELLTDMVDGYERFLEDCFDLFVCEETRLALLKQVWRKVGTGFCLARLTDQGTRESELVVLSITCDGKWVNLPSNRDELGRFTSRKKRLLCNQSLIFVAVGSILSD